MARSLTLKKWYIKYSDDLFFLAYALLFFNGMISSFINIDVYTGNVTRFLYVLFLGVCILSLLLRETYQVKELLAVGGLLIFGVISYFCADSHIFFDLTLLVSISKGIDFEKFMRRAVAMLALFLFVMICLACLEIVNSVVKERSDNAQMRNSLGFIHPNTLGILVFELIAGIVAIERKHLKTVHLWLLLGLGIVIYFITRSQSCLVGVCLLVFAALIYKLLSRKVMSPRQMKIFISIMIIALVIAVIFVIRYYWVNTDVAVFQTLTGRVNMAKKYLSAYDVKIFGQKILIGSDVALPGYEAGYSYLDNGEVWYLLHFGVMGIAVFFYVYVRMIIKTLNKRDFVLCIIAVVYLIYSLVENTAMRIPMNFMIIYAGSMLYSGNLMHRNTFAAKSACQEKCQV